MAFPIINARNIRNGWGLNGMDQGVAEDSANAFKLANCRWYRNDLYKDQSGSNAAAIAAYMVSNNYYDPNIHAQFIVDYYATSGNYMSWAATVSALPTIAKLKNNDGSKLCAIEGPNEIGTHGDADGGLTFATITGGNPLTGVGGTDNGGVPNLVASDSNQQTGAEDTTCRYNFGLYAQGIYNLTIGGTSASTYTGNEIIAPTILDGGNGGDALITGTNGWPGYLPEDAVATSGGGIGIEGHVQYGCFHCYIQTNSGGVGAPCGQGQGTYLGYQQSYDLNYMGMSLGQNEGNSGLSMVCSETNLQTPNAPDGISKAWCNVATLLDHFYMGGHRVLYYTAAGNGTFDFFTSFPTGPIPALEALANVSTLMSLSNTYATQANLPSVDTASITPAYTGSNLSVTVNSGTAYWSRCTGAYAAGAAGTLPSLMICPKSDGSTMIPIWREPEYDDASGNNTINGNSVPAAANVTVNFGSSQTFNIWDPLGGTGGNTRTVTSAPTKISGPTTATSATFNLYASPLFIELTGVPITAAPTTPSTPTVGPTTATTQVINWTPITETASSPTGYIPQYSTNNSTWTTTPSGTIGVVGTFTFQGLNPSTLYYFRVEATNSFGTAASASVSATTAGSSGGGTPVMVQSNTFRSDQPNATSTITLSLVNQPVSTNSIWVMFNGYAGTGSTSNAIVAPTGSVVVSGPNYDSSSEVTWCWIVPYTSTNSWTFSGFDYKDNAGWKIFEVSGYATYDTNHGACTTNTATAVTWPLVGEAFTNALRVSLLSITYAATIGTPSSGVTVKQSDSASVTYHQGVLLTETAGSNPTASPVSLALTNGNTGSTSTYLNVQIYGGSVPGQVTGLTDTNITSTGVKLTWTAPAGAVSYTVQQSTNGGAYSNIPAATGLTGTTTYTVTGLTANTQYGFQVYASNTVGNGTTSTPVTLTTLAQNSLAVIQYTIASDPTGSGSPTGTVTATFANPTTVGNTLVTYITMLGSTANQALKAPTGATVLVAANANPSNTAQCQLFYYQTIAASQSSYSWTGYADEAGIAVVEIQGVTSVDSIASGACTYTDNVSVVTGSVTVSGTVPNIGIMAVNAELAPASWGTMPANTTLLESIYSTGTSTLLYHQPAIFQNSSAGTTGTRTLPWSSPNVQGAAPIYASAVFHGATVATPPGGTPVITVGTTTSTTQALTWTAATGTVSSYVVNRSTSATMLSPTPTSFASTSGTITGLNPSTKYYYTVTAYNGTTPGNVSAIVNATTTPIPANKPVLIGGQVLEVTGKPVIAP